MMKNFLYQYKPHPWHFGAFPIPLFLIGWGLLHKWGHGFDVVFLACGFWFAAACMLIWMTVAGMIQALDATDIPSNIVDDITDIKERIFQNTQVVNDDEQTREKWKMWAASIKGGIALAQVNWVGSGKLFSQKEYADKMQALYDLEVLEYKNSKNKNQGYKVKGAGGWDYINHMAQGAKNLPIPSPTRESRNK